nr:hypothetical protein [Odoribacter splanchnicus]
MILPVDIGGYPCDYDAHPGSSGRPGSKGFVPACLREAKAVAG